MSKNFKKLVTVHIVTGATDLGPSARKGARDLTILEPGFDAGFLTLACSRPVGVGLSSFFEFLGIAQLQMGGNMITCLVNPKKVANGCTCSFWLFLILTNLGYKSRRIQTESCGSYRRTFETNPTYCSSGR